MISKNLQLIIEELYKEQWGDLSPHVNPYFFVMYALPDPLTTHLSTLADRMPDTATVLTLAWGEYSEQEEVIKQDPPLRQLNDFLNDLFDGEEGWLSKWITPEILNEEEK